MAQTVIIQMHGGKDIADRLKALEALPRTKLLRTATRRAANVIRDKVKARADLVDDPRTENDIAENVVTRYDSQASRVTGDIWMRVGILGGSAWDGSKGPSKASTRRAPGGQTWYWPYIEFGTSRTIAQSFFRLGIAEGIDPALEAFNKGMDRAIDRALKKQLGGE